MTARVYLDRNDEVNRERLDEFMGSFVVEDLAVSAGVQVGLESGAREWGPLLAEREESLRWFSSYVWERLSAAFRPTEDSREHTNRSKTVPAGL